MLVKALAEEGIVRGWPEVFLLREAVGTLGSFSSSGAPGCSPLPVRPSGL
ncbi:hypothetical protein MASR2M17_06000 [Aminivibrio sp.]